MSGKDHEIDRPTRLRIAANVRELKHKEGVESDAAFAERLGVSRGVVNRALKGERTVGLDFLLAVHRAFPEVSIEHLCDHEPEARWYDPRPPPPATEAAVVGNEARAAERFRAWLRWYMETHPEDAPTFSALARKLGVTNPAVHYLLKPGSTRSPSFETLVAARELIGYPLDVLLYCEPPATRPR